jgi:hypothetical protein
LYTHEDEQDIDDEGSAFTNQKPWISINAKMENREHLNSTTWWDF